LFRHQRYQGNGNAKDPMGKSRDPIEALFGGRINKAKGLKPGQSLILVRWNPLNCHGLIIEKLSSRKL
jgi:hypothetical protein